MITGGPLPSGILAGTTDLTGGPASAAAEAGTRDVGRWQVGPVVQTGRAHVARRFWSLAGGPEVAWARSARPASTGWWAEARLRVTARGPGERGGMSCC